MNFGSFVIGLLLGSACMYWYINKSSANAHATTIASSKSTWSWPDSLDALIAAPDNHKLVYEDSALRILSVTVIPGILDPIHTHKGKSIVWVTRTSPIIYNTYDFDDQRNFKIVKTDTIVIKQEELNKATWEKPEPPHSVENIGKDTFHLYRIEYKN